MISTIICDVGGVLITPAEKVTPYILSQIFNFPLSKALEMYTASLSEIRTGSMSLDMLAVKINNSYDDQYDLSNFEEVYLELYKKQAIVNDEMLMLLQTLRDRYTLVAFSNMNDLHAKFNTSRGLFKNFHAQYISSHTGLVKPDLRSFELMFSGQAVKPESCLYIDDQKEYAAIGQTFGMTTYVFDTAAKLKGYLQKNGVL